MTGSGQPTTAVELTALDGANPLAFLAALGTLVALHAAGERNARLRWRAGARWTPVIDAAPSSDPDAFCAIVAHALEGREVPVDAAAAAVDAGRRHSHARKALKAKRQEIKARGLRGAERRTAMENELTPLDREVALARAVWLEALRAAVARPELAVGDTIKCTPEEYRRYADAVLEGSSAADRDPIDLLAAFGTDACLARKGDLMEPTPFQFITGSGHQFFLRTVRDLLNEVCAARVRAALFEPWTYSDEKLSMRWDPVEDRRYALSDRNPSDEAARTVWMANLLAYSGLALFTCAPGRGTLRTVGWRQVDGDPILTWPLWQFAARPETVRSLLALHELSEEPPDHTALRQRGVTAVFRSRRIEVGHGANIKLNFSPARAV